MAEGTSDAPLIMLLPDQTHSVVTTILTPPFAPPAHVKHVFVCISKLPPLGTSGVFVTVCTSKAFSASLASSSSAI